MVKIRPVSDLRNYQKVLADVSEASPVFLTKNGHGCYAVVSLAAYDRLNCQLKLVSALAEGEASASVGGWGTAAEAKEMFGVRSCR